jgi:hypothetical protein
MADKQLKESLVILKYFDNYCYYKAKIIFTKYIIQLGNIITNSYGC